MPSFEMPHKSEEEKDVPSIEISDKELHELEDFTPEKALEATKINGRILEQFRKSFPSGAENTFVEKQIAKANALLNDPEFQRKLSNALDKMKNPAGDEEAIIKSRAAELRKMLMERRN